MSILVNVYRVANNLSDRISRDIEEFLLMVDSKELKKEVLEIHLKKRGRCSSLFGFRIDGYFRYRYGSCPSWRKLHTTPTDTKAEDYYSFDEVKAIREKSKQVAEAVLPLDNIDQVEENVEVHSLSKVDKIVEEALLRISNRFTSQL